MFTVIFKNNAGEALTTMHTKNEGAEFPPLNGGMPAPGEFPAGAVKSAVLPTGYAGRIAFAQKGKVIDGWESLIEYSLITDKGLGFAPGDIDVSYVDGFTYPIVCNCKGVRLSGCPVNLWKGGAQCPELSTQGACKNPHRMKKDITYADPWFKRCEHQAYTYSTDDAANSNGQCQSGTVECIISPK
ncbi:hypothetical protein QBC41DRAFT_235077 [Cercophora samala]|uniref:Thaumatin-like protein n=1 Tax=Cercophora samala TaxID=330535 RepID=A0AA40D488_9PEZI|nr:hypothetical protein QBC41DRAFT_235077 [Cercophora samala]